VTDSTCGLVTPTPGGQTATATASSAAPEPDGGCNPSASTAPIVGSWFADVYFPGQPFPGAHESTFVTFTPSGGITAERLNTWQVPANFPARP
jgi:hypothetical protein